MVCKTPAATYEAIIGAGVNKGKLSPSKTFTQGIQAGAHIALGALFFLLILGGMPGFAVTNPGFRTVVASACFPTGLITVVLMGSELFTGNVMAMSAALFAGRLNPLRLVKNWVFSYSGNFIGSIFCAWFVAWLTNYFVKDPWNGLIKAVAVSKTSQGWGRLICKGVGANWLVCIAVWQAVAADDVAGKFLGIWFPITAFVAIGFEHSIANMFIIPLGMMYGADVTIWDFVGKNLIPVTIGNIAGPVVFMSLFSQFHYGPRPKLWLKWLSYIHWPWWRWSVVKEVIARLQAANHKEKGEKDAEDGSEMEEGEAFVSDSADEKHGRHRKRVHGEQPLEITGDVSEPSSDTDESISSSESGL